MIYLIGSIFFSTYLTLFFKVVQRFGWSTIQVIVANYITCVITGCVVQQSIPGVQSLQSNWMGWALAMGVSFILLFNIIGYSTQRIGISVTTVAYKLSLVIPFLFSIYLYKEVAGSAKIAGVILALLAVVLTCYRSNDSVKKSSVSTFLLVAVPAVIFIWSGLLDTAIKFVEYRYLDNSNNNTFLIIAFGVAAVVGAAILLVLIKKKREKLSAKSLFAGIALGIPNYFSIWCLIMVLKVNPGESAVILTINNIAIVLLSAIAALVIFKEKLSLINWMGIVLALIAILLMSGIGDVVNI